MNNLVSVDELERRTGDPSLRIVDCRFYLTAPERGHAEYLEGHIPGAVYAHLDHDLAAPRTATSGRHPLPDAARFAAFLGECGIAPDTAVVAYDHADGSIAARLWWLLRWAGHRGAAVLDGGLEAWRRRGLPLETEVPHYAGGAYPVRPAAGMVAETPEIEQAVAAGLPLQLVDARAADRYEGRSEPIDAVAGRIPGARNLPLAATVDAQGQLRPAADLARIWSGVLDPREPWIAMCGSGVTACHLALSAAVAGLPPPRVYVGSFSEWIRDPRRPVAGGPAGEDG